WRHRLHLGARPPPLPQARPAGSGQHGGRHVPPRAAGGAAATEGGGRRISRLEKGRGAMLKDFRAFILRGNVVDLAVAVVVGAAFGAVVSALVKDLVTPIISIPGKANFQELHFTIRHSVFAYGDFINAVIAFVSIATAVFFFVVVPVNKLMALRRTEP